jgi:hypothetical protein
MKEAEALMHALKRALGNANECIAPGHGHPGFSSDTLDCLDVITLGLDDHLSELASESVEAAGRDMIEPGDLIPHLDEAFRRAKQNLQERTDATS